MNSREWIQFRRNFSSFDDSGNKYKYFYSLQVWGNKCYCLNNPFMGTYLNHCYSSQFKIELSNHGKKVSGDHTIIPSTSDVDSIEENSRKNVEIHATWVMIPIISYSDETFGKKDIEEMYHLFKKNSTDIDNVCKREIALGELIKPSESSWFQLPYINQAHLSIGK